MKFSLRNNSTLLGVTEEIDSVHCYYQTNSTIVVQTYRLYRNVCAEDNDIDSCRISLVRYILSTLTSLKIFAR